MADYDTRNVDLEEHLSHALITTSDFIYPVSREQGDRKPPFEIERHFACSSLRQNALVEIIVIGK